MSLRRSARQQARETLQFSSNEPNVASKALATGGTSKKAPKPSKVASKASIAQAPPSTPQKKRKLDNGTAAKAIPFTPTPAAVGMMVSSYSTGDIEDAVPSPKDSKRAARPTGPHMTNATLRTPNGSKVIAMQKTHAESPLMKPSTANDQTTTDTLLATACAHLIKTDPKLKPVIVQNHCRIFSPEGLAEEVDPFRSLVSGIMAQQVSGAAATSIKNKFIGLFHEGKEPPQPFPTPSQVAETELARLRLAGLSGRKAEYVKGLAERFANGELTAKMLAEASDEEVLEKLIAVRGLGQWSCEMFMTFALKRMNVFSTGDLGVQRGMAAYVGRDVAKLKAKGGGKWKYMSEKDMLEISAKFAPYRSLFMWLMWRIEDVDVSAIQGDA